MDKQELLGLHTQNQLPDAAEIRIIKRAQKSRI